MNRKSLLLNESEKNRILNMHKTRFEVQKNFIFEAALNGQVVQGPAGDPYQYKGEGGKVFYANKTEGATPNWVEQKKPEGVKAIQDKILNTAKEQAPVSGGTEQMQLKPKALAPLENSGSTQQLQGVTSQNLGSGLASRKDLRQGARQQRQDDRQDARQLKRATKEQEQECNTWFKTYGKFKSTMSAEQLKQYSSTLNAKPCCEILDANQMKSFGLTSCAAAPTTTTPAPTTPAPTTPAPLSGAPTPPPLGTQTA